MRRTLTFVLVVASVLLAAACTSDDDGSTSATALSSPVPSASPTPTSTPAPPVALQPGEDIQAVVDAQPAGTHYILAPGIYREQTITPQSGDIFEGQPGAILSGARILEAFEPSNGLWSIGGQPQFVEPHGGCSTPDALPDIEDYNGCRFSEQLFFDDEPLWQVTAIEQLAPGRWYFDYETDRIYLADDPTGRVVETSVTSAAFQGQAADVTVRDLIIEKYASRAQRGAIEGSGTRDWVVANNEIRLNHGFGLRVGTGMQVRDNLVHRNGQVGLGGVGNGVLVEGNEVAYNHTAGFNEEWEAGGMKFAVSSDLVIRDNWVHHNAGRGIWTDIDIFDALIVGNLAEWNSRAGIVHEISFAAQILDNVARFNGLGFDTWVWGAQILVQNSSDVIVSRNTVTVSEAGGNGIAIVNQERGAGDFGPYRSDRVSITDNVITHLGMAGANGAPSGCATTDSTFDGNRYEAPAEWFEATNFEWCALLTWDEFRLTGQESAGTRVDVDVS